MAAPRGRGLRPGGVVRALLRLLVLVALGFGLGLLFGVVTEEPELLAGHLAGESESVSLEDMGAGRVGGARALEVESAESPGKTAEQTSGSEQRVADAAARAVKPAGRPVSFADESAGSIALPRVAAAPSVRDRTAEPAVPVTRAIATPDSAMRPAEDRWSIQVGAFSDEGAADRLAEGLRQRYPVTVLPASATGGRWRVRVQPIRGEALARQMAEDLKRDERLPTWVTPLEERAGR